MDWSLVLLEMPLTRFEECWPLPRESLPELPYNLNLVTLTLALWPINSDLLTSFHLPHLSSSLTDTLPSLNVLCHSKTKARFMQRWSKSSLKHSIRFCGIFSKFKTEFYCIKCFSPSWKPSRYGDSHQTIFAAAIIIITIVIISHQLFADCLLLKFEWLQVSSNLQDSSLYSRWSQ